MPGIGVVVTGVGCDFCTGALVAPFNKSSFLDEPVPSFGIKAGETIQRTPTIAAKTQVPFSITSVDCFTPINWLLKPPKEPESPPPFGFCINTIKPKITQGNNSNHEKSNKSRRVLGSHLSPA